MRKVLAAIDGSAADTPVLMDARALADLLAAELEAIHVEVEGGRAPESEHVPLRVVAGVVVDELARAGEDEEVVALVLGARGLPTDPRPLGATAEAVATRVAKPVLIVPPDGVRPAAIRRILVPLEGTLSSSRAPRLLFELARGARLDVVALHVLGTDEIPSFTDQPQHEHRAWATEFLARYCPAGNTTVRLETRIGRAESLVPLVADECGCDLIALGWAQELAPGHAPVVREALRGSQRPVLLVPVQTEADSPLHPEPQALAGV
jgi:nucleotide-binding universal stress UspA family protein